MSLCQNDWTGQKVPQGGSQYYLAQSSKIDVLAAGRALRVGAGQVALLPAAGSSPPAHGEPRWCATREEKRLKMSGRGGPATQISGATTRGPGSRGLYAQGIPAGPDPAGYMAKSVFAETDLHLVIREPRRACRHDRDPGGPRSRRAGIPRPLYPRDPGSKGRGIPTGRGEGRRRRL